MLQAKFSSMVHAAHQINIHSKERPTHITDALIHWYTHSTKHGQRRNIIFYQRWFFVSSVSLFFFQTSQMR